MWLQKSKWCAELNLNANVSKGTYFGTLIPHTGFIYLPIYSIEWKTPKFINWAGLQGEHFLKNLISGFGFRGTLYSLFLCHLWSKANRFSLIQVLDWLWEQHLGPSCRYAAWAVFPSCVNISWRSKTQHDQSGFEIKACLWFHLNDNDNAHPRASPRVSLLSWT